MTRVVAQLASLEEVHSYFASDLLIAAHRAAQARFPKTKALRPVLIHGQFLHEEPLDSYKALGVIPSLFPMHTFYWGDWHRDHTVGPALADNISPTGWVVDRGGRFGAVHRHFRGRQRLFEAEPFGHHREFSYVERGFYGELCAFMASEPVVVQVLEGEGAIAKNREVMGATDPAAAAAGTIRKEFALSKGENSVHGSDSAAAAAREISFFFSGLELVG